ncbi:hypothetical protein pipiens_018581, partial [Culex pipiens pipiens]
MVARCLVASCRVKVTDKRFKLHKIPAIDPKAQGAARKRAEDRQNLWKKACGLPESASVKRYDLICSRHFVSGKPSRQREFTNVDWVPTQNLEPEPTPRFHEIAKDLQEQSDVSAQEGSATSGPQHERDYIKPTGADPGSHNSCHEAVDAIPAQPDVCKRVESSAGGSQPDWWAANSVVLDILASGTSVQQELTSRYYTQGPAEDMRGQFGMSEGIISAAGGPPKDCDIITPPSAGADPGSHNSGHEAVEAIPAQPDVCTGVESSAGGSQPDWWAANSVVLDILASGTSVQQELTSRYFNQGPAEDMRGQFVMSEPAQLDVSERVDSSVGEHSHDWWAANSAVLDILSSGTSVRQERTSRYCTQGPAEYMRGKFGMSESLISAAGGPPHDCDIITPPSAGADPGSQNSGHEAAVAIPAQPDVCERVEGSAGGSQPDWWAANSVVLDILASGTSVQQELTSRYYTQGPAEDMRGQFGMSEPAQLDVSERVDSSVGEHSHDWWSANAAVLASGAPVRAISASRYHDHRTDEKDQCDANAPVNSSLGESRQDGWTSAVWDVSAFGGSVLDDSAHVESSHAGWLTASSERIAHNVVLSSDLITPPAAELDTTFVRSYGTGDDIPEQPMCDSFSKSGLEPSASGESVRPNLASRAHGHDYRSAEDQLELFDVIKPHNRSRSEAPQDCWATSASDFNMNDLSSTVTRPEHASLNDSQIADASFCTWGSEMSPTRRVFVSDVCTQTDSTLLKEIEDIKKADKSKQKEVEALQREIGRLHAQ